MRFDGGASPKSLGVHDYFPDLVFQGLGGPVHTASLADINDVLTKLQAWPVEGRFVLDLRD